MTVLLVVLAVGFTVSMGAHYTGACMGMPHALRAVSAWRALLVMAPLTLAGAALASHGVEHTVGHGLLAGPGLSVTGLVIVIGVAFGLTSLFNMARIPTSTIQILVFSVAGAGLAAGTGVRWATIATLAAIWAAAPVAAGLLGYALTRALDLVPGIRVQAQVTGAALAAVPATHDGGGTGCATAGPGTPVPPSAANPARPQPDTAAQALRGSGAPARPAQPGPGASAEPGTAAHPAGRSVAAGRAAARPAAEMPGAAALASGPLAAGLVGAGALASFTMGGNDVANATGSLVGAGIFSPAAAGLIGGLGLAAGVLTWGRPLLRKVAFDIVTVDRPMATAAQLVQAAVVLAAVGFGFFTSMNQALIGAMTGAAAARGRRTVHAAALAGVLRGWLIGPAAAISLGYAIAVAARVAAGRHGLLAGG